MQGLRAKMEEKAEAYARRFAESGGASAGAGGGGGGVGRKEIDEKLKKFAAAIESRMGGAISSQGFGRTLKKFQKAVRNSVKGVTQAWGQFYLFVIVLLLLFIVHQVTLTLATPLSTHTRAH